MACPDSPGNSLIELVIGKNPRLEIDSVEMSGASIVSYALGGTMNGEPVVNGDLSVSTSGAGSPCVFSFIAT